MGARLKKQVHRSTHPTECPHLLSPSARQIVYADGGYTSG